MIIQIALGIFLANRLEKGLVYFQSWLKSYLQQCRSRAAEQEEIESDIRELRADVESKVKSDEMKSRILDFIDHKMESSHEAIGKTRFRLNEILRNQIHGEQNVT